MRPADPANPKLLLLGGFPASSHQFRNLIPALADRFHVLSPDYPGFGNTEMPDPATWDYTFDHLAEIVDGLLDQVGFTGAMGIFMQDYGGPIGNRLIARHPEWLQWQVIQNANTYEEGFTEAWDGIRHALWVDRSAAERGGARGLPAAGDSQGDLHHRSPGPEQDQPGQLEHRPVLPEPAQRPPGAAGPVLRLPDQRRSVRHMAGVAS